MVELKLARVGYDPESGEAFLLLRDDMQKRYLPIAVGPLEAHSIAAAVEHVTPPRPLTHDLMMSILELLHSKVNMVLIDVLRDKTFFAQISLETPEGAKDVDARPSDGIALAVRAGAPIYALEAVLDQAAIPISTADHDDEEGP